MTCHHSKLFKPFAILLFMSLVAAGCRTRPESSTVKDDEQPSQTVLNGFSVYCGDCHEGYVNDDFTANWEQIKADATEIAARINPDEPHRRPMPPRRARFDEPLSAELRRAMYEAVLPYADTGNGGIPTDLPLDTITLPEGFSISVYAEVTGARSLALSPSGTLFVGTGGFSNVDPEGRVFAVRDTNNDNAADEVVAVARGLNNPNGVAFKDGDLFIAEINRILKLTDIEDNLNAPPRPTVVNDDFPRDRSHGWKYIAFGPDGKLYVPVGAPCNICDPDEPYARIHRMNADGTGLEVYAEGVRNTVGFDWHPETGELWFTDNGRDNLGNDIPPDELNHAPRAGMHFGYPHCHGTGIRDPEFGRRTNGTQINCNTFTSPKQDLGPHVAALGMTFYDGNMFPEEYKNRVFIGEHGSWNRTPRIGYRVSMVTFERNGRSTYRPFAEGWLQEDGTRWGRPVDVLVAPDGALFVSDDKAGVVYRIAYSQP